MRYFSKLFICAFAVACFVHFMPTAEAGFIPFKTPSIKNDYCGPVMSAYNCKCAWHNQYCDTLGSDQATQAAFVTNAFNVWVEQQKEHHKKACADSDGIWDTAKAGCMYCDSPTFNMNNVCKTVAEICSGDTRVMYDPVTKQCLCPADYRLTSGKECESVCGEIPHLHYNPSEDKCYCDPGFELQKDSSGDSVCAELPEIELWVHFDQGNPPFLADGKTSHTVNVEIFRLENGEGVEATFDISYSNAKSMGKITNTETIDAGKYVLTYVPADLSSEESGVFEDQLYIHYFSTRLNQQIYKTHAIPVAVGMIKQVKISKPGYEDLVQDVVFTGKQATIKVSTMVEGASIPVVGAGATVAGSFETVFGNSSGEVVVTSPVNVESDLPSELEVVLTLSAQTQDDIKDAFAKLNELGQMMTVSAPETFAFAKNFPRLLAASPDDESAKKLVSGIKRVKYAVFYIVRGHKLSDAFAIGIAGSMKDMLWDIMDMVDLIGEITDAISSKLTSLGESAIQELFKEMAFQEEGVIAQELENIAGSCAGMTERFMTRISTFLSNKIASRAPHVPKSWSSDLMDAIWGKIADYGWKNAWDAVSFENFLKKFFVEKFEEQARLLVSLIEDKVKRGDFDTVHVDSNLLEANWKHDGIMSTLHIASYRDVIMGEFKAEFEFVALDITGSALNILTAGSKVVKLLEKAYKTIRLVINNDVMYEWYIGAGKVINDTTEAVVYALGGSGPSAMAPSLLPRAFAEELPASTADAVQERDVLHEYQLSKTDTEFYGDLQSIADSLARIFPDQKEAVELKAYISGQRKEAETLTAQLKKETTPLLKGTDSLDENGDGKITLADITSAEWAVLGGAALLAVLVIWFMIRLVRRIFRGKQ